MRYSAVFIDRDGTLVRDPGYLDDPAEVELIDGAADAIRLLNARSIPVIIVTNQSGIGRGYYTEGDFEAVQAEVDRQLAVRGSAVEAVYFCPHDPDREPPCDCRKPELGMYREAAERFDLELAQALYIGDKVTDVLPAVSAGGRGILVETGHEAEPDEIPGSVETAPSLYEAVSRALGGEDGG